MAGVARDSYLHLLESGFFSDLIVECQGVEFKVHRAIMCSGSPMLLAACNGSFKEAEDGRVKFPEEDPKILSRVIFSLYTGEYNSAVAENVPECFHKLLQCQPIEKHSSKDEKLPEYFVRMLKTDALVYKCADMLGINFLKGQAAKRFLSFARKSISCRGFEEAMILMYESTAHDDQVLRVPATRCLIQKHTLVAESEEVLKVVLKYEPVAWELGLLLQKEKTEICCERGELENAVENFVRELSNTYRQSARLRLSPFMPPGSLD
ncbi:BTB/POZ domain [Exophiala xenobiotica]|nr:BTB/POZ domain [Exophiala xenobiotica]